MQLSRVLFFTVFILTAQAVAQTLRSLVAVDAAVPRADISQCTVDAIWPTGPGNALQPQAPPADLQAIVSQIDPKRIEAIITKLVSFGTRHTLSNQTDPVRGIGAARDWIVSEMRSLVAKPHPGTIVTVDAPSFIQPVASGILFPVNITNIIATIQGTDEPNRVYIITGHYDSRVTDLDNFTDDAPGADDDASGVAIVMELTRIMAQHPPPRATIMLGAVAGEEQGLYGSANFAQNMKDVGADVQGMFTNDIVGSPKGDSGFLDPNSIRLFAMGIPPTENMTQISKRVSVGGENDSPARQLDYMLCTVRVIYREDRFLRGGDHFPFLDQGFAAARFTEPLENFAHQHQDVRVDPVTGQQFGDLIEFVDFDYVMRVGKVNGAAIWSLAQAPGTPQNVLIDTSVLTNNSTLTWNIDTSPAVSGYEIVWRATEEPFWTNVIPVGLVDRATILLAKDNAIMGVRAVGKNGYRSPATFPFRYATPRNLPHKFAAPLVQRVVVPVHE